MKNYYDELIKLLTYKYSDGSYLLNNYSYLQLRFFIDTISQSERFLEITHNKFNENIFKSDNSRSIDLSKIFDILSHGNSKVHEFIDLLKSNKCMSIYTAFNTFRNNDYRLYIKLMKSSQDFSIDNGRIKFQYIYVTPTIGSYIMLVDDDTYLENLDNTRVTKGLRELTNLGNIKKSQEKKLDKLRDDLDFESCYV